jgi:23S rRNA pseudouridine955/2504/2580 synthase
MGHPLVGDEKYGIDEFNQSKRPLGVKRLFLHAAELGFYLPSEKERTQVRAPLPADLAQVIVRLVV